jgi:hypothetical protein
MQKETKFKIEGEIEGPRFGVPENKTRVKRKNYKPALLFFIILSIVLLALSTYLWFWGSSNTKKQDFNASENASGQRTLTDSLQHVNTTIDSLNILIQNQSEQIDKLRSFSPNDTSGVFFEVQIGNFKDFNLDNYLEEMANLRQEKYEGGSKFLLGKFRSYKKALLFENDLKRLGMRDVFIKGRIHGNLVSKEEALEYLRKN